MRVMSTSSSPRKLTYRDFVRFPDDGKRHELIDGVHYVTPSPVAPHQRVIGDLYFLLRLHLEEHGGGEVFLAPFDVIFSFYDIVEPDLLYISDERKDVLTHKHVRGSPDLVIEVLSPSTGRRDEGVKLALYDRADVAEYWILDPDRELIRVYRRVDGRLKIVEDLRREAEPALRSPLFPGLSLSPERVFAARPAGRK